MGNPNRGKDFEQKIRESLERVCGVSLDRMPDPTNGYMGVRNICDFMVYKYPFQYYFECKCTHETTLHFSYIRDNQWNGLMKKNEIDGVVAGIIVWFILYDRTIFVPIWKLQNMKIQGMKSIRYDINEPNIYDIFGKKQRIYYDYDMEKLFEDLMGD